jgi:hypothetical protein
VPTSDVGHLLRVCLPKDLACMARMSLRIWSLVIGSPGILLPGSVPAAMRCRWTGDYMSDQHRIE